MYEYSTVCNLRKISRNKPIFQFQGPEVIAGEQALPAGPGKRVEPEESNLGPADF